MPATQSKTDANKTDTASPFALLVGSTEAKPVPQQPATQQKDAQGKDKQNSSDQQNNANAGGQASVVSTQTASQAPVKASKDDDKKSKKDTDKTGDGTADTQPISASLQQVDPQNLPAVQMSAQQLASLTAGNAAAAATNDDAGEDQPAVAVAGAAGVAASAQAQAQASQSMQGGQDTQANQGAQPDQGAQAGQGAQANQGPQANQGAQTNQGTQTGQGTQARQDTQANQTDVQAASQPAASQAANQAATQGKPGGAPNGQTKPGETSSQTNSQAASQTANTQAQTATAQNTTQPVPPDGVQPLKPWQDKPQDAGGANKTDSSKDAKADDVKQAATPALQTVAAGNALPVKPADATGNTMPAIGATTPQTQTAQSSAAPTPAQNIQVSTPAPNMPALAVDIAARSLSGAKQFDIRLDPPELGRVEVRLSIDATGKASAHLSADQPQTLTLLQKDAPALTRALRDAGLNVAQNGLNFSLRQQSSDAGAGNNSHARGSGRSFTLTATTSADAATSAGAAYRAPADGRLDIRV
jgi:flagellar hook-length control protein FliK